MRPGRAGAAATAAALLFALAACGLAGSPPTAAPSSSSPPLAVGGTRPLEPPTHPHALRYCPAVDAVHLETGADAVDAVYTCTVEQVPPSQNGLERWKQTVERIDPDAVAALLADYAEPDAVATGDSCAAVVMDPLVLWVHSGGLTGGVGDEIVAIRAPVDGCGFPTDEATAAYQAAPRGVILVAREAELG
jgi:hypothetical protein